MMKNKFIFTLMLFCMTILAATAADAATYYVSNSGNDAASGLSESSAWRTVEKVNQQVFEPGDEILFQAGGIWNGCLWVRGSGTKNSLIRVGKYGEGAKPCINGNGENAAVFLYNQQYMKISNLEITNQGEEAWRYGVYVCGYNAGALNGIELNGLTVHDVNGYYTATMSDLDNHWNGGILVSARGEVATRFVGLTITGCEVYNVARTGIATFSNFYTSYDKDVAGMTQQLKISNNIVHDVKGDGIIVCGDYNGTVTGNTVYETNLMSYQDGMSRANVGIFALHSTGTVIAENESYLSRTTYDGFGYDIDGDCDNVKLQYNYSHDNEGGFVLLVNHHTYGATVRYNISQNDKNQTVAVATPASSEELKKMTAEFYNNTIYSEVTTAHKMLNITCTVEKMSIMNNIFYLTNPSGSAIYNNMRRPSDLAISNNIYYGNNATAKLSQYDTHAICQDPMLTAAGSGAVGRTTLDGYKLQAESPAIGAGCVVENNGGYDFWGNRVSDSQAPNIGAYGK